MGKLGRRAGQQSAILKAKFGRDREKKQGYREKERRRHKETSRHRSEET